MVTDYAGLAAEVPGGPLPPIHMEISPHAVNFTTNNIVVGTYVRNDPWKPHFHPLRTPEGDLVTLAVPWDHRHHKGLMFALRTDAGNFWEEQQLDGASESPGREIEASLTRVDLGNSCGFRQVLNWTTGSQTVFSETRTVTCRRIGDQLVWRWEICLVPHIACRSITSEWAKPAMDGRLINYHGLGIRLPRSFEASPRTVVRPGNGGPSEALDPDGLGLGIQCRVAAISGPIDGAWPPHIAEVTITQFQDAQPYFTSRAGLAYLSVGPTTSRVIDFEAGRKLDLTYEVTVRRVKQAPDDTC